MNQAQHNTSLFEEFPREVTITDPTHPLFGQTLPVLPVKETTYRRTTHLTVVLPTGRRRSIPRQATTPDPPAHHAGASGISGDLLPISVRTILPLARFVAGLHRAKEEQDATPLTPNASGSRPGLSPGDTPSFSN
jgi:hypothetical protein